MIRSLLMIQGIYTSLTGAWPLVHMRSFLFVTGPKTDLWLVNTVALTFVCVGLSFLFSLRKTKSENISFGIIFLAMSLAFVLGAIDTYYSVNDIISNVYLIDAFFETLFFAAWVILLKRYSLNRKREIANFTI